jgi:hypothetical protein
VTSNFSSPWSEGEALQELIFPGFNYRMFQARQPTAATQSHIFLSDAFGSRNISGLFDTRCRTSLPRNAV